MINLYTNAQSGAGCRMAIALLLCLTFYSVSSSGATVSPGCDGPTFLQNDRAGNGLVVMEAERPTKSSASTHDGHAADVDWWEFTLNSASNSGYVRVPTSGQNASNTPPDGARLDFEIEFSRSGSHYLDLRYWAPSGDDNSVHVAINGRLVQQAWQLAAGKKDWEWSRMPTAFSIPVAGVYTLTVFHREDGLFLDKLGITTDSDYRFSGFGPDVTERLRGSAKPEAWRIGYHEDNRSGQGITSIEAESPTNNIDGRGAYECRKWDRLNDDTASGGRYMTTANWNMATRPGDVWSAPRLDYEIEITEIDTHFIHILHRGSNDNNSIYVAVDHQLVDGWHIAKNTTGWTWETPGVGYVATHKGKYLLSLIMREDGTPIDKIIITTDRHYRPGNQAQHTTEVVPPNLVYTQSADGNLELPMEKPTRNLAGLGRYSDLRWKVFHSDAAIDGCFVNVPNSLAENINLSDNLSQQAPLLEYEVNFTKTGPHFLYMRHKAPNGDDNSYSYFFDGVKIDEVHIDQYSADEWIYHDELPSFEVPATGRHTFSIYLREDGTPLDHLLISPSPTVNSTAAPIELTDLDAVARGSGNLVTFTSAREENTDRHLIERSTDGLADWQTAGIVSAAGHSNSTLNYSFIDRDPTIRTYYRITTVDVDGSRSTSAVVTVQRESVRSALTVSVYPNPATDYATLRYDHPTGGKVVVSLFNPSGATVALRETTATSGKNQLEIPLDRLASGTYVIVADLGDQGTVNQRLVVRH